MTILEQIWYEEIHPAEIIKEPSAKYSKLTKTMGESELKLLHLLTDEGKELFHSYTDSQSELHDMDGCDIFITGVRTGAKLMLEIMGIPTENKKGE